MENKKTKKELKEEIKELSEEFKQDLTEKTKELKEEIKEKTEELKEELKEKGKELKEKTEDILNDVKNSSKKFDKKDIEQNKMMAVLSYIIPPIPYFLNPKSKWIRYHAIQGMNLLIVTIILSLAVSIINSIAILSFIKNILNTITLALIIIYVVIGIVNVCNGEAKELPIINKFKIIKK